MKITSCLACLGICISTGAQAQERFTTPHQTPQQHRSVQLGVLHGREAAAQDSNEAAHAYTNAYNAAVTANSVMKYAAGAVPGGRMAYSAGNQLGTYMMTHPVTTRKVVPLSVGHGGYMPPRIPVQVCAKFPSYPSCGLSAPKRRGVV